MDCREFEVRWQEVLDARRVPREDAELTGHALACERCREVLALSQCLVRPLTGGAAPPRNLADQVLAAWLEAGPARASAVGGGQPPSPPPRGVHRKTSHTAQQPADERPRVHTVERGSSTRLTSWLAAAAAVLLVVGTVGLVYRTSAVLRPQLGTQGSPFASQHPAPALPSASPDAFLTPDARRSGRPADESLIAYQQLLSSLSSRLREFPHESVGDLTGSLRPVADSVGSALDALRRSIPLSDRATPAGKPQARASFDLVIA